MKEENKNFYPIFKLFSINNNINPTVDILIESIDRFSFGDESDDAKNSKKDNDDEKKRKDRPNNYSYIKADNDLIESNSKLKDLNDIINNIDEINIFELEGKKNKGKICGIFNKEDFEIKLDNKKNNHKNNQLNDSFEKKYNNPLKNFLEDEEEDRNIKMNNKNNNKNNNDINNKIINEAKIEEEKEIKNDKVIKNEENKDNNNNLANSNSKIEKDNYDLDDEKIPVNEKDLGGEISKEKEILKESREEEEKEINKENLNNNKIDNNPINQLYGNKNDELESPRLGNNFIEEKEPIKKSEEKKINLEISKPKESEIIKEKENRINNKEKEEEKKNKINKPLNANFGNKISNNRKEDINEGKKEEKNKNLEELKENSFIIKQSSNKEKKVNNEETNKEILELKQKLEKSEKDAQIMKEEKEKLLEVINMFKNLQSIDTKKLSNSGKNSRSDTPKRQIIKKRCYTPTLSRTNIIYGNGPIIHHKRSNSYNKMRIIKNSDNKLYIDYLPTKQKTYRQLHGKENIHKKGKKVNQKININDNPKMYGNYINRNTIYLTGASSNKYAKSPYLNNNMNYTGISYNNNLSNKKSYNSYNNYLYVNNSSQSFYINNNNFENTYGNLYQRQVMQLPPNEQPLFYETRSNINNNNYNNNIYQELVYNKNINYNSENNFNKYKNIIENKNKYLQEMPFGFNNTNDLSLNTNTENHSNKTKRKNKLLDIKDFQIIFEDSNNNQNTKVNLIKNDNKNIINNNLGKKNNNNNNIIENNNYPNKNYNLINYIEYSNYKLNELNNSDNPNNFEVKKSMEKLSKGMEDDNLKKKSKDKNSHYNNLNFGIINNCNKNKKKNHKNNNEKNNINNVDSKEFGRNKEKLDFNNCLMDSDDFNGIVKEKKKNKRKENYEKLGKDYMMPFYLINRNEMINNILNYISNDKVKRKVNIPINEKKKNN